MSLRNLVPQEQNIFMQRLKDKALAEALKRCETPKVTIPFDLQGRVILNLALSQDDVNEILKSHPNHKKTWQALVGRTILVSLDVQEHPKLQEAFDRQLADALVLEAGPHSQDILTAFKNRTANNEMIALQRHVEIRSNQQRVKVLTNNQSLFPSTDQKTQPPQVQPKPPGVGPR